MEGKRFLIIIATTFSAILLWVSVNMSYEHYIVLPVPLVVEHVPENKAIASPLPKSVQLKLRGNGWRSAALMLGAEPRCMLDVSSLPQHKRVLTLSDIVERMPLPSGIQPVDMRPETVFVSLDHSTRKRVPVTLNADLTFRAGYGQVGETLTTPESVLVTGAASLLPDIVAWPTTHMTLDDLKSPVDAEVSLADSASQYIALTPRAVRVQMDVQQFAEKTIAGLPVEILDAPLNKEVVLIPPKIDLIVRGSVIQLSGLSNDSFHISIDYGAIVADSTGYTDPLVSSPRGVQLVTMKPDRMQFIIRTRL